MPHEDSPLVLLLASDFLVAGGLINTVNVHLVTCRSPALASVVMAAADHTSELPSSVLWHHLNQSVIVLKIAQLLLWLEKD